MRKTRVFGCVIILTVSASVRILSVASVGGNAIKAVYVPVVRNSETVAAGGKFAEQTGEANCVVEMGGELLAVKRSYRLR